MATDFKSTDWFMESNLIVTTVYSLNTANYYSMDLLDKLSVKVRQNLMAKKYAVSD